MGLFGDDGDDVRLQLERREVVAGAPFAVRLLVERPEDIRAARLELVCRNAYVVSHDEGADRLKAVDLLVATSPLRPDGLANGEAAVRVAVPTTAPGTAPGIVDWRLRAVVERLGGREGRADEAIVVRVPHGPLAAWSQTPSVADPGCEVTFDVVSRDVAPGGSLTGSFRLTAPDRMLVRCVRIRLVRVRYDPNGRVLQTTAVQGVAGKDIELEAGRGQWFTFSMIVPEDATPSFVAEHNHQHWFLELVLERRRHRDLAMRLEVVVANAPPPG